MQNPAHGNVMSENTQSERNLYCFVFKLYFKRFNIITDANIYVRVYGIIWFDFNVSYRLCPIMSEYHNVNSYVMHMTTTRGQQTTLTLNSIGLEKKRITLVVF